MRCLFALLAFFLGFHANACDCDSIKGFKEAVVVFKGKVLNVQRIEEPYRRYEITFQVKKWMKGAKSKRSIVIDTPCLVDGCCGIPFQKNETYKVYAFKNDGRMKTTHCWETHKID